ncbi:MAG: hypothetical protein MO852_15285 [Candidatus Devosia euplotis]|nr:hypothetical protein [Candidatus Devosia euplotis]
MTFEFTNGGAASAGNQAIDVVTGSPDIDTVLASMQAALRSAGGPAAVSSIVDINGGNLRIGLGSDYHARFIVTSGTSTTLGALGLTAATTSSTLTRPTLKTVAARDDAMFKSSSVAGGAITVYAPSDAPANVQMRWAKVDSAASGGQDTWNLLYMSNSAATGTSPM